MLSDQYLVLSSHNLHVVDQMSAQSSADSALDIYQKKRQAWCSGVKKVSSYRQFLSLWGTDSAGRLKRQARCIGGWVRFSVETGGRGRRSAGHDCARGPPSRLVGRTPYYIGCILGLHGVRLCVVPLLYMQVVLQ